jgi:HlyD family secretion protein
MEWVEVYDAGSVPMAVMKAAWLRQRWPWLLALGLAVVGVGVGVVVWTLPTRVEPVAAVRREVVQTVVASGRVLPAARVQLAALGLGRVVEVAVPDGAQVTTGQLLARLDGTAATADLARAEAALALAEARLTQLSGPTAHAAVEEVHRADTNLAAALDDLGRLQALAVGRAVTEQELARAVSASEVRRSEQETARIHLGSARGAETVQAQATVRQALADVDAARARLADLRLVAPADGQIVTRAVEAGDVVTAGQLLFELAVKGPVEVRIDPDESTLARLAVGLPALVSPEAFPERRFGAEVSYLAPAVDPQRGTIEVRLAVAEPPPELRADMTVSVDVEVARNPDALVLPVGVVRDVGTRAPWVLVVVAGRVERRDVKLGAEGEELVELLSGVAEGDLAIPLDAGVVVGDRVRVWDPR